MKAEQLRRILVRCEGARMPLEWRAAAWTDQLDVSADPASSVAVNLAIQGFAAPEFARLRPRTEDLLRIAASIFRADELVSRGSDADVHGDQWIREYGLCIAVRDPAFWSDPKVQRRLAALISFGADDRWEFAFSALPKRGPVMVQTSMGLGESEMHRPPQRVVLCSGGIDSLAILLEAAARGERPVAVSHWASPATRSRQELLLRAIGQDAALVDRLGGWRIPSIGVKIQRLGVEARERTRRTRSVLFTCLGAAAAAELGIDHVDLGDNGPISLNLPINDQIVGAHASRSTHPVLLQRATDLMALVYDDRSIRFENPLWSRTRAEVVESLKDLGAASFVSKTLSCSNWGWGQRSSDKPHCGYCSQCIDRRFATIAADVEQFDPPSRYHHDIFLGPLPDGRATLVSLGYVRFAQRVVAMSPLELLASYPQLAEAILPDDPDPEATMQELIDLTDRHAQTVLRVMDKQRDAAKPLFSRGKVSASSLLVLSAVDPSLSIAERVPHVAVELSGQSPAVEVKRDRIVAVNRENVFIFRGESWEISFNERMTNLRHSEAVVRLAFLLDHPGECFSATELLAKTRSDLDAPTVGLTAELHELRIEGSANPDPIYDPIALRQIAQEIARLDQEIAEAESAGDDQLAAAKLAERQEIETYRNQGTRPGNKVRSFRDTKAKIEDTVSQSLRRLLRKLDSRHPALAEHLHRTLKLGTVNAYLPDSDVRWRVTHPPKAA